MSVLDLISDVPSLLEDANTCRTVNLGTLVGQQPTWHRTLLHYDDGSMQAKMTIIAKIQPGCSSGSQRCRAALWAERAHRDCLLMHYSKSVWSPALR
jgi:hypothetical protein